MMEKKVEYFFLLVSRQLFIIFLLVFRSFSSLPMQKKRAEKKFLSMRTHMKFTPEYKLFSSILTDEKGKHYVRCIKKHNFLFIISSLKYYRYV
jgi:hypothetical protein